MGQREKVSRSVDWLVDRFLDWLYYKIADLILSRLFRKVSREALKRVGRAMWHVSPILTVVLGFVFQKEVLAFINAPYFFWVGVAMIGSVSGLRLYFRAKNQLANFSHMVDWLMGHGFFIVFGGLAKALYDLAMSLLPFWQNPWIFVALGLYSFLVVNVWWMRKSVGKMIRWKPTGHPVWRRLV